MIDPKSWPVASTDDRRVIRETGFAGGRLLHFSFLSDCVVGNHFHQDMDETFMLVAGSGRYALRKLWWFHGALERVGWGPTRGEMVIGHQLPVLRMTAHAFCFTAGSQMLCWASGPFDAADLRPCPIKI